MYIQQEAARRRTKPGFVTPGPLLLAPAPTLSHGARADGTLALPRSITLPASFSAADPLDVPSMTPPTRLHLPRRADASRTSIPPEIQADVFSLLAHPRVLDHLELAMSSTDLLI